MPEEKPKYILTVCGTSIITNLIVEPEVRQAINRNANKSNKNEIEAADLKLIEGAIQKAREKVQEIHPQDAKIISAELNSLTLFLEEEGALSSDVHVFLGTDTFLGNQAAELVREAFGVLYPHVTTLQVRRPANLRTDDFQGFNQALAELAKDLTTELEKYRETSSHKVIFNLTGGFKGILAFLQTLAQFYADESIYIFERSDALLRIPRLPLKWNPEDAIRENIQIYRRLAKSLPISDIVSIPEIFYLSVDNEQYMPSAWGEILWEKAKPVLYREKVYDPPIDKIIFSEKFKKNIKDLKNSPERCYDLNKRIDDLSRYLIDGTNPDSLKFKPLKSNIKHPSTHEFKAWSDKAAWRVFCWYDDHKNLVFEELDEGLH